MERWHGAIPSCLVEKEAFGKAGREKGIDNILARHEARVKRPSADVWDTERKRRQEARMRGTEVWWEVGTKSCRDLV